MPAAEKAASPPKSGAGRSVFSVLVLALLALAIFFTRRTDAGVPAPEGRAVGDTLHLETFVLNLADRTQRSYLRVGIDLGLSRRLGKGESAPPIGVVRDTILGVLGRAQLDDAMTGKGKAKLKENLLRALQERMPGLNVEEVYFTEFLIQR